MRMVQILWNNIGESKSSSIAVALMKNVICFDQTFDPQKLHPGLNSPLSSPPP